MFTAAVGVLVRLTPLRVDDNVRSVMNRVIDVALNGCLMPDIDGRVIAANRTFVELAQLTSEEEAQITPLQRWARPNPSLQRIADGRPAGPIWR